MKNLKLIGWRKGLAAVSLTQLISQHATHSLIKAKRVLDELLNGNEIQLTFANEEDATLFREKAEKLGAIIK